MLDFIRYFREEHTLLLVDPVMGDDGNAYPFFTPGLLNGMKELTLFESAAGICADIGDSDGKNGQGKNAGRFVIYSSLL